MKKQLLLCFLCFASFVFTKAQTNCSASLTASLGSNTASTNIGTDVPLPSHCQFVGGWENYLWYTFTSSTDTMIRISTVTALNTGLDTRASVFNGTCGALTCVAYGDDESAYLTIVEFAATAGVTYYIVFDTYWGDMPVDFTIEEFSSGGGGGGPTQMITFTQQAIPFGQSSRCVVDMNNDQLDDIVVTNGNSLSIHYQSPTLPGTFTSQTFTINGSVTNPPSWSIAGGDMNNDGYTDLIYGGGSGASIIMANSTGTGYTHFSDGNYIFSQRTNVVDVNNDGIADAFICHDVDANVWYESNGDGTFVHHQGGLGPNAGNYGSVWIDYDNDCDIDLFIAKCGSDAIDQLHRNNGDGTYTSVGAAAGVADASQTWSSAWADYDNDGDMDVFIGASSSSTGSHKFYRNNGDGTFTNITAGSGFDNYAANMGIENQPVDFNNDGWVDVYGLGGLIMFNNGDMTFTASTAPVYAGATGDLNHDGYIDIVSGYSIYYNNVDTNNYLTVSLVGTQSNKQGIGARITIYSALGSQIRDVRSGEAFSSMQTLNAHFGLGQDTEIVYLSVCWPSGTEDIIETPAINSHLVITEGMSSVGVIENENSISKFHVYPNPANENVILDFISAKGGNHQFSISDINGKLIFTENYSAQKGANEKQISLSGMNAGIYLVTVTDENGNTQHLKLVKE